MRGSPTPIFANQDAILSTGMRGTHVVPTRTYTNVVVAKPSPIVLRFAHPYARYTDSENSVAYIIFGPGQAAPKHWKGETQSMATAIEPSVKWTVAAQHYMTQNGSTNTFEIHTEPSNNFPNEISNTDLASGANQYLPKTTNYTQNNVNQSTIFTHWESPLDTLMVCLIKLLTPTHTMFPNHFGSTTTWIRRLLNTRTHFPTIEPLLD